MQEGKEETLQIAEKRSEKQVRRERIQGSEFRLQLNSEFQRIAS